jgi:MULE transposase domain
VNGIDSYQLIVPYLKQFQQPSFMNASLQFVRPVMSLDATHMKCRHKGTLYLATVKTGLNEIYTVAISIQRTNECYNGWKMFLIHLKDGCPLLDMDHTQESCGDHAYFTFVSDRNKGLVQALEETFPRNHTTHCSIHIQRYVQTRFRPKDVK